MNHPPQYPDYVEPGEPHWRRWWLALLALLGAQSAVLLTLWPEGRPRLELWQWGAVLPLCWLLLLTLRALVWQVGLVNRDAYRRTIEAAVQRWWRRRSAGLPVDQVLLLGPAGDDQEVYQRLMMGTPLPGPSRLRCPMSLKAGSDRLSSLAVHLARLALALPDRAERWPHLRGLAWAGDASSQTAFVEALAAEGLTLPDARWPLRTLDDLDGVIDAFQRECIDEADGLLCAGVVSVEPGEEHATAGEAAFLWVVSRKGMQRVHRGEYLLPEPNESPAELCAQMQRYAGLRVAPSACLAMDNVSQSAFVEGGWSAVEHQLAEHWGTLAELTPFVGMSLALLQAGESGEPCGWLGEDGNKRLAMGVAVPHGKG